MYKIISGGQTGADQGAIVGAAEAGLETGGTMPKGYKTETGDNPGFAKKYGLTEDRFPRYDSRTWLNVKNAGFTIWIGKQDSPGYTCTYNAVTYYKKPYFGISKNWTLTDVVTLATLIKDTGAVVINVAGNRESKNPGIHEATRKLIIALEKELNGK